MPMACAVSVACWCRSGGSRRLNLTGLLMLHLVECGPIMAPFWPHGVTRVQPHETAWRRGLRWVRTLMRDLCFIKDKPQRRRLAALGARAAHGHRARRARVGR